MVYTYEDALGFYTVGFASIVSFPGLLWVIRKKNRSWRFLLFFLPPVLFTLMAMWLGKSYSVWLGILGCSYTIWGSGWITLLCLKNRSQAPEFQRIESDKKTTKEKRSHLYILADFYQRHSRLVCLPLLLIVIFIVSMGIISANSYLGVDESYIAYTIYLSGREEIHIENGDIYREIIMYDPENAVSNPGISFDYPRGYYTTMAFDKVYYRGELGEVEFNRYKRNWFKIKQTDEIFVRIWAAGGIKLGESNFESRSQLDKDLTYIAQVIPDVELRVPPNDIRMAKISVAGIPADYLVFYLPIANEYYSWGTMRCACFEYKGNIYLMGHLHTREEAKKSDPCFDRMIETFKMLNQ